MPHYFLFEVIDVLSVQSSHLVTVAAHLNLYEHEHFLVPRLASQRHPVAS